MRNGDHPVERQSQKLGVYRDDENDIDREVETVGPDYESVQEFWKRQWIRTSGRLSPPTKWQPVRYEWERINQGSVLTADERSHLDRCSYFKPIRAPVWDSEKVLFEPPPIRLPHYMWRRIIGRTWGFWTWIVADISGLFSLEEFLVQEFGSVSKFFTKHNKVEYSQSPVTPYNTNVRAEWQRHRATEHHQIWPSSPQKHSFHTKLSSQDTPITQSTHAMTFRKDREMHIAARQTSLKAPEEHENPDREFMKTWLGVKREFGYLRSDLLDAVLADGKKAQNQSFMGRLFDSESKTQH
ncbi:hypothetical protein AALT_g8768 [Alternaria alternata]|nr:hypothetical protein AALT_g8768 [Alternaria alternata]